jgi:hypothetical protein
VAFWIATDSRFNWPALAELNQLAISRRLFRNPHENRIPAVSAPMSTIMDPVSEAGLWGRIIDIEDLDETTSLQE